nr:DUF2061 domain-containing protein [Terasakiispira papahanaumokuakeensis]
MAKTMTFAMTHFTVAFCVAWWLTGDMWVGGLLAMVEPAINTVAFSIHEKLWQWRTTSTPQDPMKGLIKV